MMSNPVFLATNAMGVTRAEARSDGAWAVETSLKGKMILATPGSGFQSAWAPFTGR